MLTWIFAHSDALCNFLLPLLVNCTPAQQRHALNFIEALLVCPAKHKSLASLTRLLRLPHADEYACADFFRTSPWSGTPVRQAVTRFLLHTIVQIQERTGWRLLFLSIDDALCRKDLATHALQTVSLRYDHVPQRRQKGNFTNSSQYVMLHLQFGPVQFALTWRLYLKRKVVTRLNRQRAKQGLPKLSFTKLSGLVEEMLDEIAPPLPQSSRVYVLFDSWYDNHHLQRFIRAHGWHWICGTRSNRSLSDRPLGQWWDHLGHQRIDHVSVRSATRRHVYTCTARKCRCHTRHVTGRLRRYPDPVIAIISKWDRRDRHPAYFLCSDTTWSVRTIFKYYGSRWQAEVDNWFLKERLGLADYRLHAVEAIQNWHALVFAAYAFLQYQRICPLLNDIDAQLQPVSAVLDHHRQVHVRQSVLHIAALARQGLTDPELLRALQIE